MSGIVAGVAGALAVGPALESQLFGVRPRDAVTLIAVALAVRWPWRRPARRRGAPPR